MTTVEPRESAWTISRPSPDEALEVVTSALDAGAMVTLFGTCTVDYDGRASSRLAAGDRHVMLKPDGTALVHTDEGHQPVNWQPPGCEHEATVEDGQLVIRSDRSNPPEVLIVRFTALTHVAAFDGRDPADLALSGTHDDLRDRILDDPDLLEPGFHPIETERRTSAGAIDVYGEDGAGVPVVVEVKRSRVGPDAVGQLRRYVDALARDLDGGGTRDQGGEEAEGGPVRGFLVAPSATDRALQLLESMGYEFVSLAPNPGAVDE